MKPAAEPKAVVKAMVPKPESVVVEPRVYPQAVMGKTMMAKSVVLESVVPESLMKSVVPESVMAKPVMTDSKLQVKAAYRDVARCIAGIAFLLEFSKGRWCYKRER